MSRSRIFIIAAAILLLIIGIYFAVTYNRFVKKEEGVQLAWSELQNVYKRRADMVPTLVTIVKGAAAFEQSVLQEITAARAKAASSSTASLTGEGYAQQEQAQAALATSMNRLIVLVEAYPDLKATESFMYLQAQLEGTERRIKFARKDFNAAVNTYNTDVRQFPSSLVARFTGFKIKEGFKADGGAELAPEVKFH